jgi:hypothetical protein
MTDLAARKGMNWETDTRRKKTRRKLAGLGAVAGGGASVPAIVGTDQEKFRKARQV